jgi:hypothetical protein
MCLRGRSVTPDVRSDPDTNGTASGRGNGGCDCGGRRLSARDQRRGRNGSLFRRPMERTVQVGGDALPGEPSLRIARGGRCSRHKGQLRQASPTDRDLMDSLEPCLRGRSRRVCRPYRTSRGQRIGCRPPVGLGRERGAGIHGREPVVGVVRLSGVYTPPQTRKRGYAAACVNALSNYLRGTGHRCILYTDLANPTRTPFTEGSGTEP